MDEKTIRKIIRLRFRRLKKHWGGVVGAFDKDAIHDFRVEYKKLRAFLRLLSVGDIHHKIKIPRPLKEVYQHAGAVRDIQLFMGNLEKKGKEPQTPAIHMRQLKRKLVSAKAGLKKVMQPEVLQEAKKKIEKKIPGSLEASVIESFAGEKIGTVSGIFSRKIIRDNDLHTARKCLKDIIYNAKTFESDLLMSFPWKKWAPEKEKCFTGMTEELGKFQDSCTALVHLKEGYDNALNKDKALIGNIRRKQQRVKNQLKRAVKAKYADTNCFQVQGSE